MDFIIDHDMHIHSHLSLCSRDPEQTTKNILRHAREHNLKQICITDHHWDETVKGASGWYEKQDYNHIKESLPLPQDENIRFLFGCETDLDKYLTLGMSKDHFNKFDFVIIPTTHLHMNGFTIDEKDIPSLERRAELWVSRFKGVLAMDLPFKKIGIAHPTCSLMASEKPDDHLKVISMIPQKALDDIFEDAAAKGVGIELNFPFDFYDSEGLDIIGRVFLTAKKWGCKFYCGSDAHHPNEFDSFLQNMTSITRWLKLTEDDKFILE